MALELNFKGLSFAQAEQKLKEFGPNIIVKKSEIKFLDIVFEEITEPPILLLFVVGFFYSFWGKLDDAITIILIITALVAVEVVNEYRAKKAISSLSKIAAIKTKVLRGNSQIEIDSENIVPGDILLLYPGSIISADAKIIRNLSLTVDESALTGESIPVDKHLNEEIFAGTIVKSGQGMARVSATGLKTKFGQISKTLNVVKPPKTKLQLEMKSLSLKLIWIALSISILIPVIGYLRGQDLKNMILTGLALSFAVIPEELPMVITMVLGLGSYSLSKSNFLVKKIKAAENLGRVTVIVTDKTGTITRGIMEPVFFYPNEKKLLQVLAQTLTTYSDSPLDKALLSKITENNITANSEIISQRLLTETDKTIACIIKTGSTYSLIIRGAPEQVFAKSEKVPPIVKKQLLAETEKGNRLICIAARELDSSELSKPISTLEKDLKVVGLIGFEDKPRENVKSAISQVKKAGIKTIMVTGDHPQTAKFIASEVGIISEKVITGEELSNLSDSELETALKKCCIFARSKPEDKLRIVQTLQKMGEVVGVTGDGINDSLALKTADIGIAMGIKGTDVAKEASEVVIADDNYITITQGIFEGRKLFDNLKKGVKYYLSVKFALILIFLLPALIGVNPPLAPIQIIILELFMDLAASAGYVAEPIESDAYKSFKNQISEGVLGKKSVDDILFRGAILFTSVTSVYFITKFLISENAAQTLAFGAWIFTHVFLAYVARSDRQYLYNLGIFKNKIINAWGLGAISLYFLGVNIPFLADKFNLTIVDNKLIIIVLISSFVLACSAEIKKYYDFRKV